MAASVSLCIELYDHIDDDGTDPDVSENVNIIASADPALVAKLHAQLLAGFPPV